MRLVGTACCITKQLAVSFQSTCLGTDRFDQWVFATFINGYSLGIRIIKSTLHVIQLLQTLGPITMESITHKSGGIIAF